MLGALREEDYRVRLPVFEGPLDLLLQLIEREKLDIGTVSLAQVTDQFLVYVRELQSIRPDTLADFLVMASRLVWIKSRTLLPPAPGSDEEEEEDPGEALARQLREYKRFKEAATLLREIEAAGLHTYPRDAVPPDLEHRLDASSLTLDDLLAAMHAAFASVPPEPAIPKGVIVPFTLTVHDQIRLIRQSTSTGLPISFRTLLRDARHRLEIIVTLLAVLELVKRRQVSVEQADLFGEIIISPLPGVEITVEPTAGENGNGNGNGDGGGPGEAVQ